VRRRARARASLLQGARGLPVEAVAGDEDGAFTGGELVGGGGMAEGGVEGVGLAGEAGAVLLDVEGDVGEGDLEGQGAAEGLGDHQAA